MKHPESQGPTQQQGYSYCVPQHHCQWGNCQCVCVFVWWGRGQGLCREMCGPPHSALWLYSPGLCQPPLWSSSHQHFITLRPVFLLLPLHTNGRVPVLRWGSLPSIAKTPLSLSNTHTHTQKVFFLNLLFGFTQMCADDPLRPLQNTCTYASRTISVSSH